MKTILFFLFATVILNNALPINSYGQLNKYQFEQIDSLQNREKRPVLVFIHTVWCKYCQAMQNTSFKNKDIESLLNKHFYLVELDAEEKKDIQFHGQIFRFKPTGNNTGVHELAEQLGTIDGKISYPSLCFLNAGNEIIYQHDGFIDSDTLQKVLERLKNESL
jgi:thioredoxin-related protein